MLIVSVGFLMATSSCTLFKECKYETAFARWLVKIKGEIAEMRTCSVTLLCSSLYLIIWVSQPTG